MENASKALVMAGAVLIGIMVIATLLYAASTWGLLPQRKDDMEAAKQLAEFNQQFESYYRDSLYGTDLVSVLNKAIDNNKKYSVNYGEQMYINIIFTINTDIKSEKTTYYEYYAGDKMGTIETDPLTSGDVTLADGTYYLSNDKVKITNFLDGLEPTATKPVKDRTTDNCMVYTVTVSAGSEFKARIFMCTDISYDEYGRVKSMTFEEQDEANNPEKFDKTK